LTPTVSLRFASSGTLSRGLPPSLVALARASGPGPWGIPDNGRQTAHSATQATGSPHSTLLSPDSVLH
ncbi:hypothetical protein SARC_15008, partial [Sphaeroforma arctica JP610]